MKQLLCGILLVLCMVGMAHAKKFNCVEPPFGETLKELNQEKHFIKYMEKEGVTYYNYVGPCYLEQQEKLNLAIAYAFIDNKLYARLITIVNNDEAKVDKETISKNLSKELGCSPKEYTEGDWQIYSWNMKDKNLKYKLKYNLKTKMSKSAFYYTPLKQDEEAEFLLPLPMPF